MQVGVLPHRYVRNVEEAGGIAVLIPPRHDADEELVRELLDRLDGVVIAGGGDVAPELYAAERHPSVQRSRPDRDTTELAIASVSRDLDLPVLGICRGMQVMAVEAGADARAAPARARRARRPLPTARVTYGRHHVDIVAGTVTAGILGGRVDDAPTYHHQSVLSRHRPTSRRPGRRTARSRPWRTRRHASGSPCSGTRSTAATRPLFEALVDAAAPAEP